MQVSVIVIDDDVDSVEIFSEYLKIKEIEVVGRCANGFDAVTLYQKLKPDVVLLDVMMPDFDGFYGLEEIRKIDPDAKIIMVTADHTEASAKKLKELNASAVVYKPYEIDKIVDVITRVLKGETGVMLTSETKNYY